MRENDFYKEVSKSVMPDFDEMKQNAVSVKMKKRSFKPFVAIAACFMVAIGIAALIGNSGVFSEISKKPDSPKQPAAPAETSQAVYNETSCEQDHYNTTAAEQKDTAIHYNKLLKVGSNSLAARCETKNEYLGAFYSIISLIPEELNECYFDEIYVLPDNLKGTQAMQNIENYTVLHTCQLNFYKGNSSESVTISFSDKGEPLRDTSYECGKKKSLINGRNVILTGNISDGLCFANFVLDESGKTIYFDIEFSGITEEEMISILIEVINKSGMGNFFTAVCEEEMTEPADGAVDTPEEIFSNAHVTTEPPVTEYTTELCDGVPVTESVSGGSWVDINEEEDLLIGDVVTTPPYDPTANAVCGTVYD